MSQIQLCLASRLYHPFYAGGALRFKQYLPGLYTRNVQTRVFTGTPSLERARAFGNEISWQDNPIGTLMPVEQINDVPVHRVRLLDKGARRRDTQYAQYLIKFCQQAEYQPDLVQFLPLQLWYIPALLRLRQLKIPIIAVYNLLEERPYTTLTQTLKKHYWRIPFQLVNCIIVNSRFMHDNLHKSGITTPIQIIPNGVDLNRFHPDTQGTARQKIRYTLGIQHAEKLIITVGSVEPRKGTDLLLEAWIRLAQDQTTAHLVIVGPRPDLQNPTYAPFHQKLQTLTAASGTPDKIHFVGQVDNVEEYLQAADLFVFTSYREGLPNVMLEAMATALPVVTTPFIGLSDELGQANQHFLLADYAPESLAHVIHRLLSNEELRQLYGTAAHQWVMTQMNVESSLDQLATLYHDLAQTYHSHQFNVEGKLS